MPELHHPNLDVSIVVSDKMARLYRKSGWHDPQPDPEPEPDDFEI
jgi:hypothetical protein